MRTGYIVTQNSFEERMYCLFVCFWLLACLFVCLFVFVVCVCLFVCLFCALDGFLFENDRCFRRPLVTCSHVNIESRH